MKKQNKNLPMPSKWRKRTAAVVTAAVMLFTNTPINPLYEKMSDWFSSISITAKAAEEDWVLGEGETYYSITSADLLSKYSIAYHVNPTGHQNDIVEINMSQSNPSDKVFPFYSLGEGLVNDTVTEVPFRGTITINANTDSYINIDKALFAAIGEDAIIRNESVTTADDGAGGTTTVYSSRPLWISRTAASDDPIFAKKVCAKANGATTSGADIGWEIVAKTFLINGNPIQSTVSGLIGEIEDGATVKVSFADERCMEVVSSSSDVGYICGKLGDSASLEISTISSNGVTVTASGTENHAGAIVGEMGEGSALKLPYDMASFPVTSVTASGNGSYAGGIAGYNEGGTITYTTPDEGISDETTYTVNQTISGKAGSGGIFGYYEPALTSGAATLNYDDINVDCSVNGNGSSGGLFGMLYNNNGSITMTDLTGDTDHITVNNTGATANYGGLIGSYSASTLNDTLTISSGCTSKQSQSGSSTNYGGAIGSVNGKAYVRLNGFTTSATNANNFGGAVGSAEAAFIDVNGLTVTVVSFANNAAPNCGGVVNKLGNGVLRLDGTIDLTSAKTTGGQIVRERDCGLVFAESTWTFKRSSNAAADDIGSWGEVIRFQSSGFTKDGVLTHSDGDHYVTLLDAVTTMRSASDFARTALNIQHNNNTITDTSAVLRFTTANTSSTLLSNNLSLGASLSLSGTGLQGLTRDNGSQTYSAIFNGGRYTLTLAIGENYGERSDLAVAADAAGCGKIYKHTNVGLFGKTNGATIQNVTLAGNIYVCSAASQSVGAAAAENAGGFTAYGVTVNTAMHHSGSSQLLMGGLLGKSTSGNITIGGADVAESGSTLAVINACTLNMTISGTNSENTTCIGSAVGYIADASAFAASVNNVTVNGTIEATAGKQKQQIGGLIAYIEKSTTAGRTLTVDDVTINDLTMNGAIVQAQDSSKKYLKNSLSMGGLLGYAWYDTNVSLNSVTISGTPELNALVGELNGIDVDMAGLVYAGTGNWTVDTVSIPDISVNTKTNATSPADTTNVRSFGMILNKGWHDSAAIYLVLPNMLTYTLGASGTPLSKISNFSGFTGTTVFDELVAYSAFYDEEAGVRTSKVLENGQGIVSIRTRGTKNANNEDTNNTSIVNNVMKQNTCNTYQNQVTGVNMGNPNTRYYYDLDLLLAKASANLNSADKLMLWSLNKYAHSSLTSTGKPFANNPFADNAIAPSTGQTFDMDGYSYYPVDVSGATIQGTFKLYNKDIEDGESASVSPTDSFARTTLYQSGSAFTNTPYTQHHMMQNGIFLNVSGDLTVNGELTLQGTIGADTYNSNGCGVLICGTFQGDTNNTYTFESTDGSIVLDGIYVHNLIDANNSQLTYAPLLISRIDSYTVNNIANVSNTNSAVSGKTGYPNGKLAATSLIGKAGKKTTDETSQYIKFKFTNIKLDGRDTSISTGNSALDDTYHTTRSIFTRATLLEEYVFTGGGSWGEYNFKHSDDWGTSGAGSRDVTYGKEISYVAGTGEFGGKEQRYSSEDDAAEGTLPYFVRPDADPNGGTNALYTAFGTEFLPYVKGGYVAAENKHQIKVNHGAAVLTGCGTYNDPYVISSGEQLIVFSDILSGNHTGKSLSIPIDNTERANKWHGANGCQKYTFNGNQYATTSNKTLSKDAVMQYVASAYYKIGADFEIPSTGFGGLGSASDSKYAFRGVIDGNGSTLTNKSPFPLILNSNGSVVRNLTIKVECDSDITPYVSLSSNNKATTFGYNATCEAYGAVIGKVHGGDNILEHVSIDYSTFSHTIKLTNTYAKDTPVGGYIGVIVAGAVIFKDMTSVSGTSKNGIPAAKVVYYDSDSGATTENLTTNSDWLYVNPIIGRVINGYAVTESNAYRPFESGIRYNNDGSIGTYWINGIASKTAPSNQNGTDRVTMHNGTKNYSIPDIVKETKNGNTTTPYSMLQIGTYSDVSGTGITSGTKKTSVTFPNAQSMFILSCLTQGGVTSSASESYSSSNTNIMSYEATKKPSRLAAYDHIGQMASDGSVITNTADYVGYNDYTIAKNVTDIKPYLVENYVDDDTSAAPTYSRNSIYCLTYVNTVCDIGFSGDAGTWYLPDGFRGLGSVAFNVSTNANTAIFQVKNMTLSVNKVSGLIGSNVVNVNLNMNLKHYDYSFDNYKPYGNAGFGLFNTLRQNRTDQTPSFDRDSENYQIKYLDISGKVNYDVVHNSGNMEYTRYNVLGITSGTSVGTNYLHAGGLAGYSGFASNENLNVEHIGIDGLEVNGFKTSGGIFGYLKMADSSDHLATISNINTDDLTVTTKLYAGGIVGFVEQIGITIDGVTISHPDIRTYFIGNDYENGTAGIVGCVKNTAKNRPITVSNITIGSLTATESSMIGRDPSVPLYKTNGVYNKIAAAGVVGESNTNSSTYYESLPQNEKYSLILNRCHVYNVNFYGNRVAGILAHDGNGESGQSSSTIKISNVEVKSNLSSIIEGLTQATNHKNRGCGGVAGYIKISSGKYVHFDHCTVDGYTLISYNDTAGLCANLQNMGAAKIQNIKLNNLKFESCYNGGMFGYICVQSATGYNVQMNNLQFKKYNGNDYLDSNKDLGYLIGKNSNTPIQISGFSRILPTADQLASGYIVPQEMTGSAVGGSYYYGSGGYVIFADYKGASSTEKKNDWSVHSYDLPTENEGTGEISNVAKIKLNEYNTFSPILNPDSSNVAISSQDYVILPKTVEVNGVTRFITDKDGNTITYKDYYNIAQNFPFATSSPFMNIGIQDSTDTDANGNQKDHMQFLTGDGVSNLDYEQSAANKILDDLQLSTKPKNYYNKVTTSQITGGFSAFDTLINQKYSTFKTITSTEYPSEMETLGLDFPVLIVDDNDGTTLTYMLNNYLRVLTNTDYNFAANNNSAIFDLKLAKCTFNSRTKKFDVEYNSSTTQTNNASLYVDNGNFTFDINNVDSGKAQFTLIDVEFYDPSTSGNSKKVAYHLYVPVYVSQMLKFDFQISSKSGSSYKLDQYTANRRNATLENVGTPITIEARYVYQRELSEWQKAVENGESLMRTYEKTWDINDNTHIGFPKDTKMVFIDPNQGNKAFYSTLSDGQVYGEDAVTDQEALNTEVSKLYLNKFVSTETEEVDGETVNKKFVSRQFNDYFDITVQSDSNGKFIETTADDATFTAKFNGVTKYFKPKGSESGTTYKISEILYNSAAKTASFSGKTYLIEDYYLTLFTQKTNDQTMYHYQFIAPDNLGDINYPSRYTSLDTNTSKNFTRIVTGNLFEFVDAELTTSIKEGSNGVYNLKSANDVDIGSVITVDVTNNICLTDQMFNNRSFLDNTTVKINHIFMLSMNKQTGINQTSRGIEAEPAVKMNTYEVGNHNILTETTRYSTTTANFDSNYIYLGNGQDLRVMLRTASRSDGVLIHANFDLSYSNTTEITNQYPQREEAQLDDDTIGTWIGCNSSIASTESAAIASKMTIYIDEKTKDSTNSRNLYYSRSSSTATLVYSSDDFDGKHSGGNLYDQLGINAKDLPTGITNNQCLMNTVAVYDVSKLMSIIDDADGIELTFRIVRKDENGSYTINCNNADYVTSPTFGTTNAPLVPTTSDIPNASNIYTFTFATYKENTNENGLRHSGGVYTIPINFTVKTNFSGTDQDDHYYSNYKVIVSANLYKNDSESQNGRVLLSGTNADDHIIYTNAKIDADAFD